MSELLRDPWAVSLLGLLAVAWVYGFITGYSVGHVLGDPINALGRWLKRRWQLRGGPR